MKMGTLQFWSSSLDIDSEDYAIYIAENKNKLLEFHLDYFG